MNMQAKIIEIGQIAETIRAILGADDAQCLIDTLEGETDVMEWIGRLIEQRHEAKDNEDACKAAVSRYRSRAERWAKAQRAATVVLGDILDAIGERKVEHPLGTVSRTKGRASVDIFSPSDVPTQLRKPGEPDKTAIKKNLEAGEEVPGARLVVGQDGVSVRT